MPRHAMPCHATTQKIPGPKTLGRQAPGTPESLVSTTITTPPTLTLALAIANPDPNPNVVTATDTTTTLHEP